MEPHEIAALRAANTALTEERDRTLKLHSSLLNHYGELFPNYPFTGSLEATDMMAAEIKATRFERDKERTAKEDAEARVWELERRLAEAEARLLKLQKAISPSRVGEAGPVVDDSYFIGVVERWRSKDLVINPLQGRP